MALRISMLAPSNKTLSLHDALPIYLFAAGPATVISWTSSYSETGVLGDAELATAEKGREAYEEAVKQLVRLDRKSTRLNSSHVEISYAVFCSKKKRPLSTSSLLLLC